MNNPYLYCRQQSRVMAVLLLFMSMFFLAPVNAQDFPQKAIHIVVPYPPGGPNDLVARPLAEALHKILDVPIVVDNRPGAAGNIGTHHAAKAKPDGYTILLPGPPFAVAPAIFESVPYEMSDFRGIAPLAQGPNVMVVHESVGVNTLEEFIEKAKQNPGKYSYASGGVGTTLHRAAEMFKNLAGVDLVHVPYKGTSEFMPDVITGRTPVAFMNPQVAEPHIKEGTLIALGTTGAEPPRGWEDLPTLNSILPGLEVTTWFTLMAPKDTPDEIVNILNKATLQALDAEPVLKSFADQGLSAFRGSPEDADDFIQKEAQTWEQWVIDTGIERIQ